MFVSIDILISILLLVFMKDKKTALILSMMTLFLLWGLQFEIVRDWDSNIERWNLANEPFEVRGMGVNIDMLFLLILKLAKPLTFFGWLMLCAFLELRVIYQFMVKYLRPQYYWIAIFVLMLRVYLGFLMINSNRQSVSLLLTMVAVYLYIEYLDRKQLNKDEKGKSVKLVITCLMLAAPMIHVSAVMAWIIIPIIWCVPYIEKWSMKKIISLFYLIFLARYVINMTLIQKILVMLTGQVGLGAYVGYLQEMELNQQIDLSLIEQVINILIITVCGLSFKKMSFAGKVFSLCYLVSLFFQTLLEGNLARVALFLNIYLIFLIPILVDYLSIYLKTYYRFIIKPIYIALIAFCILAYYKNIYLNPAGNYTHWQNYKTVFDAGYWK